MGMKTELFLHSAVLVFDELIAKCCTQVFVVIGNYFISKFFVFRGNQKKSGSPENVQKTDGGSADCTSQERAQEL